MRIPQITRNALLLTCAAGLSLGLLGPASPALADPELDDDANSSEYIAPVEGIIAPVYDLLAPSYDFVYSYGESDEAAKSSDIDDSTVTTLNGDVNFKTDSDKLTKRAKEILDGLIADWEENPPSSVHIVGHTDSVDTEEYNQDLSERRAQSVEDYLSSKIDGIEFTSEGKGESEPAAEEEGTDAEIEAARAANRRVEISATN